MSLGILIVFSVLVQYISSSLCKKSYGGNLGNDKKFIASGLTYQEKELKICGEDRDMVSILVNTTSYTQSYKSFQTDVDLGSGKNHWSGIALTTEDGVEKLYTMNIIEGKLFEFNYTDYSLFKTHELEIDTNLNATAIEFIGSMLYVGTSNGTIAIFTKSNGNFTKDREISLKSVGIKEEEKIAGLSYYSEDKHVFVLTEKFLHRVNVTNSGYMDSNIKSYDVSTLNDGKPSDVISFTGTSTYPTGEMVGLAMMKKGDGADTAYTTHDIEFFISYKSSGTNEQYLFKYYLVYDTGLLNICTHEFTIVDIVIASVIGGLVILGIAVLVILVIITICVNIFIKGNNQISPETEMK